MLPITSDNQLSETEAKQSIVVKGQIAGIPVSELNPDQPITLKLDGKSYPAKLDKDGLFSGAIDGKALYASGSKNVIAVVNYQHAQAALNTQQSYQLTTIKSDIDVDVQAIPVIKADSSAAVEIKGKVIEKYSSGWLYFAIVVDNLASGLAGAAFIAFLSSLTSVSFTAVQYAIFSSLMTLTPKILGGYSGTIVTHIGYPKFFLMTTLIGIPILLLVLWVGKLLREHQAQKVNQSIE